MKVNSNDIPENRKLMAKVLLIATIIFFIASTGFTDVPTQITYQGKLTDNAGTALSETKSLTFDIYTSESGTTKKWGPYEKSVAFADGHFSVFLENDKNTPVRNISAAFIDNPTAYLEITVTEGNTSYVISPRQKILSAPYAFHAQSVADNAVTTAKINDGAVTEAKIGGNAVTSSQIKNGEIKEEDLGAESIVYSKIKREVHMTQEISETCTNPPGQYEPCTNSYTFTYTITGEAGVPRIAIISTIGTFYKSMIENIAVVQNNKYLSGCPDNVSSEFCNKNYNNPKVLVLYPGEVQVKVKTSVSKDGNISNCKVLLTELF